MREVILFAVYIVIMGALIGAYLLVTRHVNRERDKAIRQAAVSLPLALVPDDVSALATGYRCPHMFVTSGMGVLSNVTSSCGCAMQPIYSVRS